MTAKKANFSEGGNIDILPSSVGIVLRRADKNVLASLMLILPKGPLSSTSILIFFKLKDGIHGLSPQVNKE